MPIHDWTRVRANLFHDFHQCWTVALCNALNAGALPHGYFALIEEKPGGWEPNPVPFSEATCYARKANRVTVRNHPAEEAIAIIEVVSPGNKDSPHAVRAFARQAVEFLQVGINLLLVDLFPPGPHDPHGMHKVIWDYLDDEPFELPPDKPLTLASYVAGTETEAYVEPVAVGEALPDMPIFLTPDRYVPCPLEATYRATWDAFPAVLKGPLERPGSS
jgi:hypothetical protein